jgi:hypothetical protein
VSSEALERIRERVELAGSAGVPDLSPGEWADDVRTLLAEVARLEQERDEARKWANTMEHERDWETQVVHSELLLRAESALAALRERAALVDEPAAGRDARDWYSRDEPAAATLAEPGGESVRSTTGSSTSRQEPFQRAPAPSGSASAAADEPAHKRPASSDGMGRTPQGGHATQDPEIGASPHAAADEPGETP